MAERTRDLVDLLRAAEEQRTAALADVPTTPVVTRARAAVHASRVRRGALAGVAAAAAVAVVASAITVWSPRAAAPPAAPSPSGVEVPGLPPLRQADESDVRDAPDGSVLALWTSPDPASDGAGSLLLVRPDGEVLHVAPAPAGAFMVDSWDREAGTVDVTSEGAPATTVVDVLTGRVVGNLTEMPAHDVVESPDARSRAWLLNGDFVVERDGVEVRHDMPSELCGPLAWADDASLLVVCETLDPTTLRPSGRPGATTLLLDAASGEVVAHRTFAADEPAPLGPVVRLDDGRLVGWMHAPDDDWRTRTCPTRVDELRGLDSVPFVELPSDGLAYPGLVPVPGGLLASGTTACGVERGSPELWSVDLLGNVRPLLPAVDGGAGTAGLRSWTMAG